MASFQSLILSVIIGLVWFLPATATERREAFILHGPACSAETESMRRTLLSLPGVAAVDGRSVPGYLLVDVVVGMIGEGGLTATINRLLGTTDQCHAEPMQSCISPGRHHPTEHGEHGVPTQAAQ